jgi:hypothetical protein
MKIEPMATQMVVDKLFFPICGRPSFRPGSAECETTPEDPQDSACV